MSRNAPTNVPASVRARLKNKADDLDLPFNLVLQYYVMERFLFRLSKTTWADSLVVKGAAMLRVWDGAVARPTRDIDFLGRMTISPESVERMVLECLSIQVDDGLDFSTEVAVRPIDLQGRHPGFRAVVRATLAGARITMQMDIGIADAVVPDPSWVDYPTLLGMESPRILAYRPSTAIAEKFQTMIERELLNSRLKDYYDIWMLSHTLRFEGAELRDSIRATFDQRRTDIPTAIPVALTNAYAEKTEARTGWASFAKKLSNTGISVPADLSVVVQRVADFIMPVASAASTNTAFVSTWSPDAGWID